MRGTSNASLALKGKATRFRFTSKADGATNPYHVVSCCNIGNGNEKLKIDAPAKKSPPRTQSRKAEKNCGRGTGPDTIITQKASSKRLHEVKRSKSSAQRVPNGYPPYSAAI